MEQKIEVEITQAEIISYPCVATIESYCMARLREAEIPVKSFLLFRGVKAGVITQYKEPATGSLKFVWVNSEAAA